MVRIKPIPDSRPLPTSWKEHVSVSADYSMMGHRVVSPMSSGHIIGEGTAIFTDMTETFTDSSEQGLNQIEPPRRIQRTREARREDAIALTRQFFATVNDQKQMIMSELPVEVPTVTPEGNVTLNLNIPVTSATPTITETETRSPRTFLPNGSPSRPTATATCRPWTWVQCVSEGQINEPSREGTSSAESSSTEPYLLAKGIPENLGH